VLAGVQVLAVAVEVDPEEGLVRYLGRLPVLLTHGLPEGGAAGAPAG
jgi:hypothetical protein